MRKKLKIISIFVGIFLIVGLFGTFFFVRSRTFLNWVEVRLETELQNRIQYKVDIGKIEGNILGSVNVKSVEISEEGEPVFSTGQVVFKYNLFGLLMRKFEVKALKVDTPEFYAKRNPDGSLNLSNLFRENPSREENTASENPQFDFAVELIEFKEGTLNYTDTQRNLDIKIEGVSIDVKGPLNAWRHHGTFNIKDGSYKINGTERTIDTFNADFQISANRSNLEKLQLDFGNSHLTLTGALNYAETPVSWNSTLNLLLDVADIAPFFDEDIELEGVVNATLTADGTDSALAGTLSVETPRLKIAESHSPAEKDIPEIALTALQVDADFNSEPTPTFTLKTFSAKVADGTLIGEVDITLEKALEGDLLTQLQQLPTQPIDYRGKWQTTEVQLIPFLSMFAQLPENLSDSTGVLASNGVFNGNSRDTASLKLDSKIVLTQTTLDEVELDDSTLNWVIAAGELKINGNLDETEINITGPFPLAQKDTLDIQASGINFDDLMEIANSEDLGGTAEFSAELSDGILKGFIEIPNATFNDIPLGVLSGDFRYQEGRIFIENGLMTKNTIEASSGLQTSPTKEFLLSSPAESHVYSRAKITGTVEVKGELPADFSVSADPVYVQHYPKLLLGAEYPVEGEIRGELKLDGTLNNLDGSANFSVTEGVAWGIHLDPLTLPLEIEDYNFTIRDFKITTRGQQITLNIAVSPNGDYDLRLENDAPVRLEEIAKAANISDFPFEGAFDVRVIGIHKKPESADIRVELDFSDFTFLHNERGTKHPLGDVHLLGKLVESGYQSSTNSGQLKDGAVTLDPALTENRKLITDDYFDFQGHGFEGTSQIRGYVSMAAKNPYEFTAESENFDITPILPIVHPMLEMVTGTAGGSATISGTIADLDPAAEQINTAVQALKNPYDVDILVTTSELYYETAATHGFAFTNAEPIRLHLKDDKWTIDALSLRTFKDESTFLGLTGTFETKSEAMNLHVVSDVFLLSPFENALQLPPDVLQTGTAHYNLKMTGTPTQPIAQLEWAIPTLTLKTEVGDIDITDASSTITYQEETLRFEGCAFKLLGTDLNLEGYIDIQPEEINNSELHLRVDTITLDLATLPIAALENFGSGTRITGILEASIEIGGTFAEPLALLYAETAPQRPIRIASYIPSITLERLRIDINFDSEFVRVKTAEANGQMGDGTYHAQGKAVFSRRNSNQPSAINRQQENVGSSETSLPITDNREPTTRSSDNYFEIDVSASAIEVGDYGTASGNVKISGTGLDPQQITVIGEINALALDGYDFHLINSAPLIFRSEPGSPPVNVNGKKETLAVHIPLELTSPTMTALMNVHIGGTLDAPNITAEWSGTLNKKEWTGNIQYTDKRITLTEIALNDDANKLTLSGVIPFNLTFKAMDISDRFLEAPINVHLRGSELSLDAFPGMDTLFSDVDGTVDIDLAIQGTSLAPHAVGNVFLEALQLRLNNFHEPLQNMQMQLSVREDMIDVTELRFDIGDGYCRLEHGQVTLDGLTPKQLILQRLRLERFPLGSTVRHTLPPKILEEVEGHLTASIRTLIVPFEDFLANEENMPFPQIRKTPSFTDLIAVSSAYLSIDSIRIAFKALNRYYDFQDPRPTPIVLNAGTLALNRAFTLENRDEFSVKQTFTDEDRKPEGLLGDEQTLPAKTTLSIDEGSKWSVNGEFDGALRFKNFDVSVITETLPAPYRVTGALSGSLQMSGTSENPKITLRRHENEPAELYLHDVPIDLRWRIRYQNGKWEITEKRYVEVKFGENQLTFSWMMPYQLEVIPFLTALQQSPEKVWKELQQTSMRGILDIKVKDLDMLPSVVPGLSAATGTSEIHVKLNGTIETPKANGNIIFNNIGFELPEAGIRVGEVEGKIELSETGASIQQLDGILNDGRFVIGGGIIAPPDRRIWEQPPTLNVSTGLTSTVFEQPGQFRIELASTALRLHGDLLQPYLTGDIHISGGYYQQNWEIVRDWLTGVSVNEMEVALDYPILRDLQMDAVDINIPDNFRVLSSITGPTDIEISCLGKLVGPLNQPVFSGNVSVLNGRIGTFAQIFEFIQGSTIRNQSTVDFNPELNIFLRTPNRIRGMLPRDESTVDLQVYASLTGTLNNPNFVLSAPTETTTEVLTQGDIINFLLYNAAFSGALGEFTFTVHRPLDEDTRSISAEYPLGKNVSIKIETNEKREHGVDIELKGRF